MKCKHAQENFLLLLDSELNKKKQSMIQKHLADCSSCRKQFVLTQELYLDMAREDTPKPNPFLWTRLSAAIDEFESRRTIISGLLDRLPKLASALGMLLLFGGGVGAGIFLGSPPQLPTTSLTTAESLSQKEQYIQASGLDTFDALTPQSISSVYAVFTFKTE